MKILFATNQLDVGGIETNLVRLTASLSKRGHQIVTATSGGRLIQSYLAAGGTHHAVDFSLRPDRIRAGIEHLADVIRSERPDVIHAFSASTTPIAWLARRRSRPASRCPLIASVMGLKNAPDESTFVTYLRAYLVTLGADRVVVIAPAIEKALSRLPVRRSRMVHLPVVGVPVPPKVDKAGTRLSLSDELGISSDGPLVMTMGNLEPRNSHELFIQAASIVLGHFPGATFLVIGGGPLHERLQRLIDDRDLASRVRLVGERTDGPELLAAADVYVRPGVVEGFAGITVLEAQAASVPVVSFETEDVKLAIEHGQTGVLVKNGDVAALASTIVSLLKDPEHSRVMATEGREHVKRVFSIDAVTGRLESLYRSEVALAAASGGVPPTQLDTKSSNGAL